MTGPAAEPAAAQATLTGVAVDEALCQRIEALAAPLFGGFRALSGWVPLNTQPALRVARLTFAGPDGAAPPTVIAKFLALPPDADRAREGTAIRFANECASYRRLAALSFTPPAIPSLLVDDSGGEPPLLLLEDLGPRQDPDPPAVSTELPVLLARLHAATAALPSLPEEAPLLRQRAILIGEGFAHLDSQAQILFGSPAGTVTEAGAEALARLDEPGPFTAVVHADLSDLRQLFWRPGAMRLLDLEYTHAGHALYDLAVLFVGKLEYLNRPARAMHNRIALVGDVAGRYRAARQALDGFAVPDAVWDEHLAAALLCAGAETIGHFFRRTHVPAVLPLVRSQRLILLRLLEVAPLAPRFAPLLTLLRDLTQRIV